MFKNKILERARNGEKALGLTMNDPSEELVELAGRMGLDFVNFDGQHWPITPERVGQLCRVADGFGLTPTMRVPDGEESTILSYLDRGIMQIMVPNLLSRQEAEDLVKYSFFAPLGLRSATSYAMVMHQDGPERSAMFEEVNANVVVVRPDRERPHSRDTRRHPRGRRYRLLWDRQRGHGPVHGHPRRTRGPSRRRGLHDRAKEAGGSGQALLE